MSEAAAQKAVLASVLVTGAVIAWGNIKNTGKASPGAKQLVAYSILAAGLAVGASVVPSLAGPLAILIAVSILISRTGGKKA